jgi:hypothetical protein
MQDRRGGEPCSCGARQRPLDAETACRLATGNVNPVKHNSWSFQGGKWGENQCAAKGSEGARSEAKVAPKP